MTGTVNPFLSAFPVHPPTPRQIHDTYASFLHPKISSGEIKPLVVPRMLYSFIVLYIYLCIPHVHWPWIFRARWFVMALICWLEYGNLVGRTSLSAGTGFGNGLIAVWVVVWCSTWLVWEAPQFDAQRVERRMKVSASKEEDGASGDRPDPQANGNRVSLRDRRTTNGHMTDMVIPKVQKGTPQESTENESKWEYYWQPYPIQSFRQRADWVADLLLNFRGPGWNWEISTMPGLPNAIIRDLKLSTTKQPTSGTSSAGIRRFETRSQLLQYLLPQLVQCYLLLDLLKVLLMKDPYFIIGPNSYPLPPHLAWLHPTILDSVRKSLSLISILTALETVFLLSPLTFCLILGPRFLGLRGEAFYYPTTFGTLQNITSKGLAGFWGGWWHQTFRKGFSAPTEYLVRRGYLDKRSKATKVIGMSVAFSISGAIHAAGSHTQIPPTHPQNLFYFFILQVPGIIIQQILSQLLANKASFLNHTSPPLPPRQPSWMKKTANVLFTLTWLLATASFLTDDFARGVWLIEPIPISPLRGFGLGHVGEGWIVRNDLWNAGIFRASGWSFWESGVSL